MTPGQRSIDSTRAPAAHSSRRRALRHAVDLAYGVCCLAGPPSFIDDVRESKQGRALRAAARRRDTEPIFDWLMSELSLQGISDRVARDYIAGHGNLGRADIDRALRSDPSCPKLRGYWQ